MSIDSRGAGDVIVAGPAAWNTLIRVPELPAGHSQTLFASARRQGLGGTSAGKAVTLAALDVSLALHTVLGSDDSGDRVRDVLRRPGIALTAWPARDGHTEHHLNLMADDGGRVSIYLELPTAPVGAGPDRDALAKARVAVLDLADWTVPLLGIARAAGTEVWCDVHDDDGAAEFQTVYSRHADVLLASADRLADPASYLRAAMERGTRLAVCTRGAAGALAADADGLWEVDAAPAEVVDSNGAGDAFLAGLLAADLDGAPTPMAMAWASAAGALAVGSRTLGAPQATRDAVARLAQRVDVRRV